MAISRLEPVPRVPSLLQILGIIKEDITRLPNAGDVFARKRLRLRECFVEVREAQNIHLSSQAPPDRIRSVGQRQVLGLSYGAPNIAFREAQCLMPTKEDHELTLVF